MEGYFLGENVRNFVRNQGLRVQFPKYKMIPDLRQKTNEMNPALLFRRSPRHLLKE